jgi:hypothetical protein
MATVEIKGEQRPISRLFSDEFTFFVPPFQRPYLWETEHAGVLLEDLLDFMGDGDGPVVGLDPYFLGSIVLIQAPDSSESAIVDGQQRLITLTILLSALRSAVSQGIVGGITRRIYDAEDQAAGLPARFRLRPRPQDRQFFERYIQREGSIEQLRGVNAAKLNDAQRHMAENAVYILDRIGELPQPRRDRLAQFIIQRCILIAVSTPDLKSAYRIFSVLNDRGLDLSYADILKAEIIGAIPDPAQPAYTHKWEGAEEDLGREDFEALLSHIRMLYRKQKLQKTILEEWREYVMGKVRDPKRVIDEVVLPHTEAYAVIRDANYQHTRGAEVVNTHLRWLNRIPDTDWIPPAMLYLARFRDDPARLGTFFTDLERLAAVLMLRRSNVNKRIERYGRLMEAIERGENLEGPVSPLQLTADDRHEALAMLQGDIYEQSARLRQYVLLRLDALLSSGDAIYSYPTVSIEHVLPRNPPANSVWVKWFSTPQLRERWVHRLGNLVLLSRRKNSQAANFDFERKKSTYFAGRDGVSPFALTTQVLRESAWTTEVLERRQRDLVGRLKQLWRL